MKIKKLTAVTVCVVMIFGVFSSSFTASAAQTTPEGYISYHNDIVSKYKDAFNTIVSGMKNFKKDINLFKYRVPTENMSLLFGAAVNMYPELFYVNYAYSYTYANLSGTNVVGTLSVRYNNTWEEVQNMMKDFDEKSRFFMSKISSDMTDFEKVLILHDELILNSAYLTTGSTYTLMTNGYGKCEDYSRAYSFLLALAGIKSEIVDSDEMLHQWNKVCINGTYYNVDPTWDDTLVMNTSAYERMNETRPNSYPGLVSHEFFLAGDSLFQSDSLTAPHTDYYTSFASPSTYDNASFRDCVSKICLLNGSLYGMRYTGSDHKTRLVRINQTSGAYETLKTFDFYWMAGKVSYWPGCYSGMDSLDGLLYYSSPDAVYSYDPVTGVTRMVASNTVSDQIYGMRIIGRSLYIYTAVSPNDLNDARFVKTIEEPAPGPKSGDADGNGAVNIDDCTLIQQYLAGTKQIDESLLAAADFNGDGVITIDDATAIRCALIGF